MIGRGRKFELAPFVVPVETKAKGSGVDMERLTKNKEFRAVYKHGKAYVGRYLVLYVLPRPAAVTRSGFTVGKKVGIAVKRNLMRRRVQAAQRQLLPGLQAGYDLVWVVRPRAVTVGFWVLREEMKRLYRQAGLLTPRG